MIKLEWEDWRDVGGQATCSRSLAGLEEIADLLRALNRQARARAHPIMLSAATSDNHFFSIGLGHARGSLVTDDGLDGESPYYISVGENWSEETVWFSYMGSQSEYPAGFLIPIDLAIKAFLDCLDKQNISPLIEWHQG